MTNWKVRQAPLGRRSPRLMPLACDRAQVEQHVYCLMLPAYHQWHLEHQRGTQLAPSCHPQENNSAKAPGIA
jgi:hypothetical protein